MKISETNRVVSEAGKHPASNGGGWKAGTVGVRVEDVVIPTYMPALPDKNPMFLEKRVYQGSSGKVYPLPFTDRIAEQPVDRKWRVVWLENEFLRVMILPEIGGRIHAILDKTNNYDLIYNQRVIKPALVGLAGPWISGGIEFNWPQHHRPATFLPVDHHIESLPDGSKIVWCSDHDPMARMKGMHGVCLHPGKALLELKVRAYNRTPFTQTFLWWANVATRVHEAYQSFFPPDVYYVADHAKRAMSKYPLAGGFYYGVDYGERGRKGIPASEIPRQFIPPHAGGSTGAAPAYVPNDLSFYANIPVPTSYMCMGSREDFFGGYDHKAQAGIVHIADHHISPGKKQWTWGNHEFGYAWDRNLTDPDENGEFGPYIEIMAGVFTDNQPDFSFLQPGETKAWSQYWYPIQRIGAPQHANLEAAVRLRVENGKLQLGVAVTRHVEDAVVVMMVKGRQLARFERDLSPDRPLLESVKLTGLAAETDLSIRVSDASGNELIQYQPKVHQRGEVPPPATEPPAPKAIAGNDELYITGLHLEQYRHATRSPVPYWCEALRRDPLDSRCNDAMGLWHLRRGEFGAAEEYFRKAIGRLTHRNPNPHDGSAYYHLGLCLRHSGRDGEAYDALYKAKWDQAWASAASQVLSEIDCLRTDWLRALEHVRLSLRTNSDNLRARNLQVMILQRLGETDAAGKLLNETIGMDPLDWWAQHLFDGKVPGDLQVRLDLAHDFARAGFFAEAIGLLRTDLPAASHDIAYTTLPDQSWGALPLVHYTLGWLYERVGEDAAALKEFKRAAACAPDYCFPSRLEEIAVLESAIRVNPADARAQYYLGNLLYDRRRHLEAIRLWERSAKLDPDFSIVWRNLGIGRFNIHKKPAQARAAYERAFKANPDDARLLFERDQLHKRLGERPERRLRELEKHLRLVEQRDDLSVELSALYNQTGQHRKAEELLARRRFQPWEGGEGLALGQHMRTQLALGRQALVAKDFVRAAGHFEQALAAPENLSEARHLLANQSDVHYWLGLAHAGQQQNEKARQHWLAAANFRGDFQEMSVRAFSEMTLYSAWSWQALGQGAKTARLMRDLLEYAIKLGRAKARIDYFATSLPTMLLFDDDLQFRQETSAMFLQAQARLGLGQVTRGRRLLQTVLQRDPNHAPAADLLAGLKK